jgi:hypothetical protein
MKQFTHPVVGALELSYEDMQFVQHPGLTFLVYVPQTGSESEERFRLLASWQATNDVAASPKAGIDAGTARRKD